MTSPSAENIEPWHGQSHVRSALFQVTVQPKCVQEAESACGFPFISFHTASFCFPRLITPPWPAGIASMLATLDCVSPPLLKPFGDRRVGLKIGAHELGWL